MAAFLAGADKIDGESRVFPSSFADSLMNLARTDSLKGSRRHIVHFPRITLIPDPSDVSFRPS